MSEDAKPYHVRSPEPLAQVEPESDYYRRQMRRIEHVIETANATQSIAEINKAYDLIRSVASESLARKRSNGEAVDRLERELAELRGMSIDFGIMKGDLREARAKLDRLWREHGRMENLVRVTIGAAARLADDWMARR